MNVASVIPSCCPEVLVLRHGQTEWNAAGRLQGDFDSPLTEKGLRQARRQNEMLQPYDLTGFRFITSPQGRARKTAQIALAGLATQIETSSELMEIGMGWGVKRVCPTTGKRFYDLNKRPIVSPYTGEAVNIDTGTKTRVLAADKDDADAVKAKEAEDDLLLDDDDTELEDDVSIEDDADVLDDDDEEDTVSLDEIADVSNEGDDE